VFRLGQADRHLIERAGADRFWRWIACGPDSGFLRYPGGPPVLGPVMIDYFKPQQTEHLTWYLRMRVVSSGQGVCQAAEGAAGHHR